jgi:hypothetical protein
MGLNSLWLKNFLIDFSSFFLIGLPFQFIFYGKITNETFLNWLVVSIFVGILGAFFSPVIKRKK